ncbi:MAG: hypothetical protein U1E81_12425 [Xanthobacteraceae bacterium]
MTDLSEKEQVDSLIKLADVRRSIREGRRQIEWKFTQLAFLALAGLAFVKVPSYGVAIAAMVLFMIHTWWVLWNMKRNESDRVKMLHYLDQADKLLPPESQYFNGSKQPPELKERSLCEQPPVYLTALTALGLVLFSIWAK